MRRILLGTAGLVVFTLIAMVALAGVPAVGHVAPTASASRAASHLSTAHAPAAAPPDGNASAIGAFTNTFTIGVSPFYVLPINVTWKEAETNATITGANPSNTSYSGGNLTMWLNVSFITPSGPQLVLSYLFNGSDAFTCSSPSACTFYQPITTGDLLAGFGLTGDDQLPRGEYSFLLTSNATNQSATPLVYTASTTQASTNLAPYAAYGQFLSPVGTVQAGVLTIAGNYSGSYLTAASVTVLNASKGTVFTSGIFSSAPNREYAFAVPWTVVTPGNYTLSMALTEQWGGVLYFNSSVTVTPGVIATHTYSNSTWGIPGLGPGGSGALLVTLGVIIGIIVMALVGRSLWGGAKPAPAQPWTGEKPAAVTPGPGGTFECSVCHQTFPNEDALKEHAKSQHGITM